MVKKFIYTLFSVSLIFSMPMLFGAKNKKKSKKGDDFVFLIAQEKKNAEELRIEKKKLFREVKKSSISQDAKKCFNLFVKELEKGDGDHQRKVLSTIENSSKLLHEFFWHCYNNYKNDAQESVYIENLKLFTKEKGIDASFGYKEWSSPRLIDLIDESILGLFLRLKYSDFKDMENVLLDDLFKDPFFIGLLNRYQNYGKEFIQNDSFVEFCLIYRDKLEAMNRSVKERDLCCEKWALFKKTYSRKKFLEESSIGALVNNIIEKRNDWVDDIISDDDYKKYLCKKVIDVSHIQTIVKYLNQFYDIINKKRSSANISFFANNKKKKKKKSAMFNRNFKNVEQEKTSGKKDSSDSIKLKEIETKKAVETEKDKSKEAKSKSLIQENTYFYDQRVARWFNSPDTAYTDASKNFPNSSLSIKEVIQYHAFWPVVDEYINYGLMKKNGVYTSWLIPGKVTLQDGRAFEGYFEYVYKKSKNSNVCIHRWFRARYFSRSSLQQTLDDLTSSVESFSSTTSKYSNNSYSINDYNCVKSPISVDITSKKKSNFFKSISLYDSRIL